MPLIPRGVKPHEHGTCQLCDMFENVGHWGPPVGLVTVHARIYWPDDALNIDLNINAADGYEWPDEPADSGS